MAQPDIDALFAETLLGDYDDDKPWDAVQSLRRIGTWEVFNKAVAWTGSAEPLERARGLDRSKIPQSADWKFPGADRVGLVRSPMLNLEGFMNVRDLKQQGWSVSANRTARSDPP